MVLASDGLKPTAANALRGEEKPDLCSLKSLRKIAVWAEATVIVLVFQTITCWLITLNVISRNGRVSDAGFRAGT